MNSAHNFSNIQYSSTLHDRIVKTNVIKGERINEERKKTHQTRTVCLVRRTPLHRHDSSNSVQQTVLNNKQDVVVAQT